MHISAIQKTTLLDFPGKVSAIVFTQGCNFHCPYCHNPELVGPAPGCIPMERVLDFLHKRKKVLQGVVISGGEPTLQSGLADFCQNVRNMGYAVKLDTNGSRPQVMKSLIKENVVDYVAMDIKANPWEYPEELCTEKWSQGIIECIDILKVSNIDHEFRLTCVYPLITQNTLRNILEAVSQSAKIFLQNVRLGKVLTPELFHNGWRGYSQKEMNVFLELVKKDGRACSIR